MNSANVQLVLLAVVVACLGMLVGCSNHLSEYAGGSSFVSSQVKAGQDYPITYPGVNPSLAQGKLVWEKMHCAACHGVSGDGVPGLCKVDLSDPLAGYALTPLSQYRDLLYELPGKGHPTLENKLGAQDIWNLIFYVRSLSHPPLSRQQIAEIEPFFVANCSACHGRQGFGDGAQSHNLEPQPANFHQFNRMFDRQDSMLFVHMRDGLFPSAMPAWRGYKDKRLKAEVDYAMLRKLVQYVRQFHLDATGAVDRFYDPEADVRSMPDPASRHN